ncbi:MAG: hypothetical protein R3C28_26755 [Pirellulaceae bacterium]
MLASWIGVQFSFAQHATSWLPQKGHFATPFTGRTIRPKNSQAQFLSSRMYHAIGSFVSRLLVVSKSRSIRVSRVRLANHNFGEMPGRFIGQAIASIVNRIECNISASGSFDYPLRSRSASGCCFSVAASGGFATFSRHPGQEKAFRKDSTVDSSLMFLSSRLPEKWLNFR